MPSPCPVIKDYYDYPDYVKKLIKEAEQSKDKELQECLCKLRTPLDKDHCIIQDEDKKIVVFPFCLTDTAPLNLPDGTIADLALTYKQAMELFWKPVKDKTLKFDISAKGSCTCEQGNGSVTGNNNLNSDKRDLKSVICGLGGIGVGIDGGDPKATNHMDSGACSYGSSDYYMGLGIGLFIHYDGFQAWIDTEAKKIYPYIGAGANLGGCASGCYPDVIATSSSISGKQITINLGSSDCENVTGSSDGTVKFDLI